PRSTPSTRTVPESGISSRLQQRSSVLLPEPDGPMMNTVSPARTERSIPFRISLAPKLLRRARMSRISGATLMVLALAALRLVGCRIIAGKARHAMPRKWGDRGGAGGGCDAEPFFVNFGDGAVGLETFQRFIERVAQRRLILAQSDRPEQTGG